MDSYLGDALLLALLVINILQYLKKPPAPIVQSAPAPIVVHHHAELHSEQKKCSECGLVVVRYDERGVCANCVSEGK